MDKSRIQPYLDCLDDMKVEELKVFELKNHPMFDCFVVGTCTSSRHLKSSSQELHLVCKNQMGGAYNAEISDNWVAADVGVAVVHLMLDETRQLYDLESLWKDGQINVEEAWETLKGI